jgi:hypothetical protein
MRSTTKLAVCLAGFATVFASANAWADDRDAFSTRPAPPNIMFMLDSSGSMFNFPCREFPGARCMVDDLVVTTRTIATSSGSRTVKFVLSSYLETLGYDGATTYPYPDSQFGASAGNPDGNGFGAAYPDGVWKGNLHSQWSRWKDSGGTERTTVDAFCEARYPRSSYCEQHERCTYAMNNYGYFVENTSKKGEGDPSGTCAVVTPAAIPRSCVGTSRFIGASCTSNGQCGCGVCSSKKCRECTTNAHCGTGNACSSNKCVRVNPGSWDGTAQEMVTGNFLRFHPPKHVGARIAVKDLLTPPAGENPRQRLGFAFYDDDKQGGNINVEMGPGCDKLCYDGTCDSAFSTQRNRIKTAVNAMKFNTNTPLGETLDTIGCYFSDGNWSETCTFKETTSLSAVPPPATDPRRPICLSCQYNFAILLTDGLPSEDGPDGANTGSGSGAQSVSDATGQTDSQLYILPEVADFMYDNDLNKTMAGTQNISTYTVSFGISNPSSPTQCAGVLERTAAAGNGRCLLARDSAQLKTALQSIFNEIDQRSRTFSSVGLQSVRTSGEDSASLAVFKPNSDGPIWQGHLFGLNVIDESISDLVLDGGSDVNKNEIGIVDANNKQIAFDNDGNLLSKPLWDAALCLAGDHLQVQGALNPEDPHNLNVNSCYVAPVNRVIKTYEGATHGQIDFSASNASKLRTLLGVAGDLAAAKVINFFRGFDMLNNLNKGIDGTSSVTIGAATYTTPLPRSLSLFGQNPNWWILGDIYHSNPVTVNAFVEPTDIGYMGLPSFSTYANSTAIANRKRLILAGANDGMVHAFDGGDRVSGTLDTTRYSDGTGKEMWAFAPPHQLARMSQHITCPNDTSSPCSTALKYRYYVDGSPMSRDAYLGPATTSTYAQLKQTSNSVNWKTVTVVGDRDGGDRYTALDTTVPTTPTFLWEFPTPAQIGSGTTQRAEGAGLSWLEVTPAPASILPVRWDVDGTASTTETYMRYVVLLPGGFDRDQRKGRGIYMVDVKTGELLWKFEYNASGTPEQQAMRYSFAAMPIGVEYKSIAGVGYPYINVIVAVDTGGQVWKFDIPAPVLKASGQLASNITGQRVFVTAATSSTSAAYPAAPTPNGVLTTDEYAYRPFFSLAAAANGDDGTLWAYVGTGDRDLLANPNLAHTSGVSLQAGIATQVCGLAPYNTSTYTNRLYGIMISKGRKTASTPNTEAQLTNLTLAGSPGQVGQLFDLYSHVGSQTYGWFLQLRPGEKAVNGVSVNQRVAYYTTYTPIGGCTDAASSGSADACDAPSGAGRLYALDYQTGRPVLDFNTVSSGNSFGGARGVVTTSADTSKVIGTGVPATPKVSFGIGKGISSSAIIIPDSNNSSPAAIRTSTGNSLASRLLSIDIPSDLHTKLVKYGSNH